MNRLVFLFVLGFSIAPGIIFSQSVKGYEINGHIGSLEDGEILTMKMAFGPGLNDFELRDSGIVRHGQMHISGYVPEGPRLYWLEFSKHRNHVCTLWIDNDQKITINGRDIDSIPSYPINEYVDVEGSPTNKGQDILVNMGRLYFQTRHVIDNQLKKIRDSIGFDRSLVDGLLTAKHLLDERLYATTMSYETPYSKSMLAYFLVELSYEQGGHQFFNKGFYDRLTDAEKNSFYGKKLRDIAALSEGQPFPDFTLPAEDNKLISLKEIVKKSKLTLVHFWGSDAFSSDMGETVKNVQQELRVEYKKYNSKGLSIVGVSADSVKKSWKVRLMVEEYPWINVSDLRGNLKGSIVNDLYNEGGHHTPNVTNVLIDDKGNIVAWDVDGVELQWYLWKYLGE
jgi:peroxiredoxin